MITSEFIGSIDIIKNWENNFNSKNLTEILNLYNSNIILFPTFSNKILTNINLISDYFITLFKKKNTIVKISYKTLKEKKLSEKIFLCTGEYIFKIDQIDNFSRFTFVIDISESNPILHHHSSKIINSNF